MSYGELVVDGLVCATCLATFFKKAHGFPVQCRDCKTYEPDAQYPKATEKEIK